MTVSEPAPPARATAQAAGLVVYQASAGVDAIDEYSRRLVNAMTISGLPVHYVADGVASARRHVPRPRWILLQYNPFSYGYWGVAPRLVRDIARFRRGAGVPLAVMVHVAWVDTSDRARARWRSSLMGTYQRAQLAALLGVADAAIAATEALATKLGHEAIHVPVGSNITPLAIDRASARRRLGVGKEFVVCLFGTGEPNRAIEYASTAIRLLAERRGPSAVRVLNLGVGAPPLDLPPEVAVEHPGFLDADGLSLRLHASDVLLLPFAEGLTTGRTTLMAGLAHALPVVALRSSATDRLLSDSHAALTLTPVGDVAAFARATLDLSGDPNRLRACGEAGRELYAGNFDWPHVARRMDAAVAGQVTERRSTTTA